MLERISIVIGLTTEFWDKPPMIDLLVDGVIIATHIINNKTYKIKTTVDLGLGQEHVLQLHRYNKSEGQCVIGDQIKKDQYVIVNDVIIDGINVQNLIWDRCWYEPEYPAVWAQQQQDAGVVLQSKVVGETWLSHNGTWHFVFSSPFYKFVIKQFE